MAAAAGGQAGLSASGPLLPLLYFALPGLRHEEAYSWTWESVPALQDGITRHFIGCPVTSCAPTETMIPLSTRCLAVRFFNQRLREGHPDRKLLVLQVGGWAHG